MSRENFDVLLASEEVRGLETLLYSMGLPMHEDDNFRGTAKRWLKYLASYTRPYEASEDLGVTFPLKLPIDGVYTRPIVVQVGIPYRAVCAHHLLPVLGVAHVGYIPDERVVGLSKLARLVYGISHRLPSLQEDVCAEVTNMLMHHLCAHGAMCVISAEHGCMSARGVEEATGCIQTVTSSVRGVFADDAKAREEFYHMVAQGTQK